MMMQEVEAQVGAMRMANAVATVVEEEDFPLCATRAWVDAVVNTVRAAGYALPAIELTGKESRRDVAVRTPNWQRCLDRN